MTGVLSDSMFHSRLLAWIRELPEAMVIDPYIAPEDVEALARFNTNVSRLLTKRRGAGQVTQGQEFSREEALANAAGGTPMQVRVLANKPGEQLHDRLVLSPFGSGIMFGTSLYATQLTVVTHLTAGVTAELLAHYEPIWSKAEMARGSG